MQDSVKKEEKPAPGQAAKKEETKLAKKGDSSEPVLYEIQSMIVWLLKK